MVKDGDEMQEKVGMGIGRTLNLYCRSYGLRLLGFDYITLDICKFFDDLRNVVNDLEAKE